MTGEFEGITWPDYLVITAYFLFVLGVGLFSAWKSNKDSAGGYFLASRKMHFIPVGASLFASNIGSGHFIGLAGTAAASGIGIAAFEFSAIFFILMLGWLFVPVYTVADVYTMPEYLRKRFGGQRIRIYQSVLAIILYVFTKISADLFAGALFITEATQLPGPSAIYIAILILLGIACLFTVTGGLSAVIWTDFVQTILMIIGAFILTGYSFSEVGGYDALITKFFNATASERAYSDPSDNTSSLCGGVPQDAMHLFRDATPGKSDLPWTGMVFGIAVSSIWYWCSDQVIVQRTLAAKDMTHVKGGCVFAGYLKLLPIWIMVFPGMAARILFPDTVACATPENCEKICNSKAGCTNIAFIKLVNELMPVGLRGLMLAVMLAALMSSLTSIFNSASTIFATDIYTRIRKKAGETEVVIAGKCFVLVLVVVSVIWIPVINASQGSQLFVYIQSITSFLSPPICAVYLLAIFWPRANEPGAFWGLMVGLIIGLIRFGLEFAYQKPACGSGDPLPPDWWYLLVDKIHYLHFGLLLLFISGLVTVIVSLVTPPIPDDSLHRLTFQSRHSTDVRVEVRGKGKVNKAFEPEHEITTEKLESSSIQASNQNEPIPKWRQAFNFLCGVKPHDPDQPELPKPPVLSIEEEARLAAERLDEHPTWKRFVNINAIILMSITCFIWGFYA